MNAAEQFALSRDARVPAVGLRLLAPGETHRLRARGGVQLCAMAGCLWVTESGVDADRFVGAGQSVLIGGRGRVVIECVSDQAALLTVQPAAHGGAWQRRAVRIARASVRIATWTRGLAAASAAALAAFRSRTHQAADPGLGALPAWQLTDIGAPDRLIQAARERERVERRWRDSVLDCRRANW